MYLAHDGNFYPRKETRADYTLRHLRNAVARSRGPYLANDGNWYSHKESRAEYELRKFRNALRYGR